MADDETLEIYERLADRWAATHAAGDADQIDWVEQNRADGPVVDIGCGPGWHLPQLQPVSVALDAAAAMLAKVAANAAEAKPVQALADALPFADRSLGGAVANQVYLHLPTADLPAALADLHRALKPGAAVFVSLMGDEHGDEFRSTGPLAGRLFSGWSDGRLADVCLGAGFSIDQFVSDRPGDRPGRLELRLTRQLTLPDTVSGAMRLSSAG